MADQLGVAGVDEMQDVSRLHTGSIRSQAGYIGLQAGCIGLVDWIHSRVDAWVIGMLPGAVPA